MQTLKVQTVKTSEKTLNPLNEYNEIAVGDCVRVVDSDCFGRYERWLDMNGFDKTGWVYSDDREDNPPEGAIGFVLGIGYHSPNDSRVLFYVDICGRKWIMGEKDIELEYKVKKETKNYCLVNRGKMNFYIIE